MVPFVGWEMPLMYSSILTEYDSVRHQAGLFDVSHMGNFEIKGKDAFYLVQKLITNNVGKLNINQILYTPMCKEDGGIIDDLLVYRLEEKHFMFVVNACNIEKDYQWVVNNSKGLELSLKNTSYQTALIALQGPNAKRILQQLVAVDLASLKYYWFIKEVILTIPAIISRTGYTGELGYEIYVTDISKTKLINLWNVFLEKGAEFGLNPCGLGARDILRLEMKYALYGSDIDETTNPIEAGLGWTVKFEKGDFNGKKALLEVKNKGVSRKLIGFVMLDRSIARHGYAIFKDGEKIGYVSSGSFSPILGKGIGMGYVKNKFTELDTEFNVDIRNKKCPAKVVKTPFYNNKKISEIYKY